MHRSTSRRLNPLCASLVALTLTSAVAACGAHGGSSDGRNQTSTPSVESTAAIPETPVGDQLRWVLDHLASGGQPLTVDEINRLVKQYQQMRKMMKTAKRGFRGLDLSRLPLPAPKD